MSLETKIKDIVVKAVHKIGTSATAQEAAALMVEKDIGCLLVSGNAEPVGILTERDLIHKVTATGAHPAKVRVSDIMSAPLISVSMDTSIGDAAQKMVDARVKRLVVRGEDGNFFGLLTMTDLVRWLAKQEALSDSLINYLTYGVP